MANSGWDAVRRRLGNYPVPPKRPGGKWRPAGADAPPGPLPTLLQEVASTGSFQLLNAAAMLGADADTARARWPEFDGELAELGAITDRLKEALTAWRKALAPKLAAHAREQEIAWHKQRQEAALLRREEQRKATNEKRRKERAKTKRAEQAMAKKAKG